ncbi:hypothetical protein J4464_03730 [Candidatus Woesearchaeota archaeon]|nr:hypothetical protein [Candidatus Woesearchaeota archaeon]
MSSINWDVGCAKRAAARQELADVPSGELTDTLIRLLRENKHHAITGWDFVVRDVRDELFYMAAAGDELRERHGDQYVLDILGKRTPQGLREKLRHYLTGNYPRASSVPHVILGFI